MTRSEWVWDSRKAALNWRRHRVTFEEAATVFEDETALSVPDEAHSQQEARWLTIGRSAGGAILTVAHTAPKGGPGRIISARYASRRERHEYDDDEAAR
jgi:uncharacterized protein